MASKFFAVVLALVILHSAWAEVDLRGSPSEIHTVAVESDKEDQAQITVVNSKENDEEGGLDPMIALQVAEEQFMLDHSLTLSATFATSFKFSGSNVCYANGGNKPRSWSSSRPAQLNQPSALKACATCAAGNRFYSCGPYPNPSIVCPSAGGTVGVVVNPDKSGMHTGFVWRNLDCRAFGVTYKAGQIIQFKVGAKAKVVGNWI